jgi:beta-glucanase (GH16 family)
MLAIAAVIGLLALALRAPAGRRAAVSNQTPGKVGAAHPTATATASPGAGHLAFNAWFRGTSLDRAVWSTCYPWATAPSGCTNFGNREYQWYTPGQVRVSGGALRLTASPIATTGTDHAGTPHVYACRSGMVTSYPGYRFEYGYVKIVAHIPAGYGLWPALWLAAANLRWPPEVDMLEHWGGPQGTTGLYLHPVGATQDRQHVRVPGLTVGWHTFALSWTPSRLTWYIDGQREFTVTSHVPHQPMYLIANVAEYRTVGPSGGCNGTMLIRSVQVWQR